MQGRFTVSGTIVVNPVRWQSEGYGPTITSSQVRGLLIDTLTPARVPGTLNVTVVSPAKVKNQFTVSVTMTVYTPWWKLGFGTRSARQQVSGLVMDAVNDFAVWVGIPQVKSA